MNPKAIADWLHDTAKTAALTARAVESMQNEHKSLRELTLRAFEWRVAKMMVDTMRDAGRKKQAEAMLARAEEQLSKTIDSMLNNTLHPEAKK